MITFCEEGDTIRKNNPNIFQLQFGCYSVAVVILHVHKYEISNREFNSRGLYEKHAVATWKLGKHLSIRL
jgi:hypothetical protein